VCFRDSYLPLRYKIYVFLGGALYFIFAIKMVFRGASSLIFKAFPLQAWTGPEGSRKLRFPDFVTTSQDGGKVVSLRPRPPLSPGNTPGTHFC